MSLPRGAGAQLLEYAGSGGVEHRVHRRRAGGAHARRHEVRAGAHDCGAARHAGRHRRLRRGEGFPGRGFRDGQPGGGVILSSYVIEHRIGAQPLAANLRHRLRWNRSTRRSRPAGYVGQLFTNPLPLALLLWAARPQWWPAVAATVLLRAAAGLATAGYVLRDPLTARLFFLVPLQDLLSFAMWLAGFFGNTILWRGRKYYLQADGRFVLVR